MTPKIFRYPIAISHFLSMVNLQFYDFRSSRDNHAQNRKPVNGVDPLLPPPPASRKPVFDSGMVDYLSGDAYKTEVSTEISRPTSFANPAAPPHGTNTSSPIFSRQPVYDEPSPKSKSSERLPPAPWDTQSSTTLPPPPSKFNQRQQFFEQQGGTSHSSSGSSSYDSLVGQTQNLSLNSSGPTKQEKQEDTLFKDLVDFAKSKTSSSSKPNHRSF